MERFSARETKRAQLQQKLGSKSGGGAASFDLAGENEQDNYDT